MPDDRLNENGAPQAQGEAPDTEKPAQPAYALYDEPEQRPAAPSPAPAPDKAQRADPARAQSADGEPASPLQPGEGEQAQPAAPGSAEETQSAAPAQEPPQKQQPAYELYEEPPREPLFGARAKQGGAFGADSPAQDAPLRSSQPYGSGARAPRFPDGVRYAAAQQPAFCENGAAPVCAGFWPRLFALLLDTAICGALAFAGYVLLLTALGDGADRACFFSLTVADCFALLLWQAYFILTTKLMGGTLGKRALRLRVVSSETLGAPSWWQVFFRESFGRFLSSLLLIGYFFVFGAQRQTLHDRLADTLVVYR